MMDSRDITREDSFDDDDQVDVNTFAKDCEDPELLKTMGYIRVGKITESLREPMMCLKDPDYVA